MSRKATPVAERLWAGSARVGDCLVWQGTKNGQGYGQIREGNARNGTARLYRTHRLAYVLTKGPIPEGMDVCHRCDNPPCIDPSHLFAATRKGNMEDCVRKDRQVRGERNGQHKLTDEQVGEIRKRASEGERPESIRRDFGVTRSAVELIVAGKRWALR